MEDTLLTMLRDGIREEIAQYEQLHELTECEHRILADKQYTTELATVAAKKLRIMREINELAMRIGPLKVRWKLEDSRAADSPADEIPPLLDALGSLLERILDVDEENQKVLSGLIGAADTAEADRGIKTASAARAYGQQAAKS